MGRNGWIGMLVLAIVAVLLMFGWTTAIEAFRLVRPTGRTTLAVWLNSFQNLSWIGIGVGLFASLVWYCLGEFVWKVADGKVGWWITLLVLSFCAALLPTIFLPSAQNLGLAYVAYFTNFFLVYYLSTVFFSPDTVRYVPPGAGLLNR